jgi:hypothetical protein
MIPVRVVLPRPGPGPSNPWFERDSGKRLAHDREIVAANYPQLVYRIDGGQRAQLRGPMLFRSEAGITTRVTVRVDFGDSYPQREPIAYDDDLRFPEGLDRHLLSGGRCCLWLPQRSRWKKDDGDALLAFLDEVAVFFDRQLIYDATGRKKWPGGQYPHGHAGYLECTALPDSCPPTVTHGLKLVREIGSRVNQRVVPKRQTESLAAQSPHFRPGRTSAAVGAGSRHAQNALILAILRGFR